MSLQDARLHHTGTGSLQFGADADRIARLHAGFVEGRGHAEFIGRHDLRPLR